MSAETDDLCPAAEAPSHDPETCKFCKPDPDARAHHEAVCDAYAAGDWQKFNELVAARMATTTNTET